MLQMSHERSQSHAQRLGPSFASPVEAWADFARLAEWLSSPALAHRAGGPRDAQQRLRRRSYIVFGAGKSSGLAAAIISVRRMSTIVASGRSVRRKGVPSALVKARPTPNGCVRITVRRSGAPRKRRLDCWDARRGLRTEQFALATGPDVAVPKRASRPRNGWRTHL
jgi:hypothetical protein